MSRGRKMAEHPVVVIGAGIGGLSAAACLAAQGLDVLVIESASEPGGKIRALTVGDVAIDAGPSVLTMRWVFDELFAECGGVLADHVTLTRATTLARHAWNADAILDLHDDPAASEAAIGAFAGARNARGFRDFRAESKRIYDALESPFLRAQRPNLPNLMRRVGPLRIARELRFRPYTSLWRALGDYFPDPRVRQLFGRYATYCGASPFAAAATLMLVAHVEQDGVWLVDGGMQQLSRAVARLAASNGAKARYGETCVHLHVERGRVTGVVLASGERIAASAVIFNGDPAAIHEGRLGKPAVRAGSAMPAGARSLSATTWHFHARPRGFPLVRHTVFFSDDYRREFDDIFLRGTVPHHPSVYVCAQDRDDHTARAPPGAERLQIIVNAPATGDKRQFYQAEIEEWQARTMTTLKTCGLELEPVTSPVATTPNDFAYRFPGSGGALYGRVSHGWMAAFQRPPATTRIRGLYLAGGATHPGPGLPMATLSGQLAARKLIADRVST